jgi:hypothetical protein
MSTTMLNSYQTYFRDIAPILRDMSARGIPIDDSRRQDLKALIAREDERVTKEIQLLVPAEVLSTKQKNGLKRPPILKCEDCGYEGRGDHVCTIGGDDPNEDGVPSEVQTVIIPFTHLAEQNGLVQREVTLTKEEKCPCLKKSRASCPACLGTGTVPAGTVELRWAAPVAFNPNSKNQVIRFMKFMKHPVPKHQKRVDAQGEASDTTEMKELERLFVKTKHPIYPLLIQKRQLTKVEGTYCSDSSGWAPMKDGCVHTTYGLCTATWQTTSKAPNVQNGLKHGKTPFQKELANGFLSMQRAKPGRIMINLDFSAFHALTTAHDFNIPAYARLARIDIHSFVACHFLRLPECKGLYERDDADMKALFKYLRKNHEGFDDARAVRSKQTILGIQFGRGPMSIFTMYKEFFNNVGEAKTIHELVYALFPRLRIAQNEVKAKAAEDKRLVNKFGAIRHFFDVQRWDRRVQKMVPGDQAEQAVAFLPASHAFGHFRDCLLRIHRQGWDSRYGLCNQIHDSMVFHCPTELKDECVRDVKGEMERPSTVLIYPVMAPGGFQVNAEEAMGDSMYECK